MRPVPRKRDIMNRTWDVPCIGAFCSRCAEKPVCICHHLQATDRTRSVTLGDRPLASSRRLVRPCYIGADARHDIVLASRLRHDTTPHPSPSPPRLPSQAQAASAEVNASQQQQQQCQQQTDMLADNRPATGIGPV